MSRSWLIRRKESEVELMVLQNAMPSILKSQIVMSNEELEAMTTSMKPLVDKLTENNKQIRILEKLRDTLLPKLMSGEVRVSLEQQEAVV